MGADVVVVGGGTAGVAAALEAVRLGAQVALVDPLDVEGAAGRAGAVPLAVLRDVTLRATATHPRPATLHDLAHTVRKRRREQWTQTLRQLQRARVRVEQSRARISAPGRVDLEAGAPITANTIVVATGSRPRRPNTFPFDDELICDCQTVLRLRRPVRSVVVLGAEEEGCELACVLAALGAHVTLIERRRKLFRLGDRDVLAHLHAGLRAAGITVVNEDALADVAIVDAGEERHVRLALASGRTEISDLLLVVAGRVPNLPPVGPDVAIATDEQGFVVVDEAFRTSAPGVYAIGDVTGPPFRIGTALYQARTAVWSALAREAPPAPDLPMAVHTIPQIATVGLGEDAARMLGQTPVIGVAREEDLAVRGMSYDPLRLLKLTFDRDTRRLVGAQIAGGAAVELIHLAAHLLAGGSQPEDIVSKVFAHPSQADAFRVAAASALDAFSTESAPSWSAAEAAR